MKNNTRIYHVLFIRVFIILLCFILVPTGVTEARQAMPLPTSGLLDISSHDLYREGNIRLDGQWQFFKNGHEGSTLERDPNPDFVKPIKVDRATLPEGTYKEVDPVVRQVIDIDISKVVTEYRAQVLEDENGTRYTAVFPEGVTKAIQYGVSVKAHATFFSQYQLIPYDRVEETFRDQLGIAISKGSVYNFNKEAFERLEAFDQIVKLRLFHSDLCHADETGININSVRHWLHCTSNALWTYFFPHEKRGKDAMDEMGILPLFKGVLCHDHWKPYLTYDCLHALCNAHHLRELQRAWEQDNQAWARDMRDLLKEINKKGSSLLLTQNNLN